MKPFTITVLAVFLINCAFSQADSAKYFLEEGNKKFESGLYNAAQKDFEKAIKFNPGLVEAYIANGKADLKASRIYQAGQNFNRAYALDSTNTETINLLLEWNFNNHQNQKTIEFAGKCGCKEADRMTGMSYYRMEDYGKAESYLLKALKSNPEDAEAAYSLGRTYMELENTKLTIKYYQIAVAADAHRSNWQYELALLYYNVDDYKNSLKCFENARDGGYRVDNDFLENMGFCQLYAGEIDSAMQSLKTVMDRKPNNAPLMSDIAFALYNTKRYRGAVEFYEKALTINPQDAQSLFMAGMSFQKMGQKEKGQSLCDAAIKMDPSLAKNRQKKEMPMGL